MARSMFCRLRWFSALAAFLGLLSAPSPASALLSFGGVDPISSTASTDGIAVDLRPSVAGDGSGNWIVVWDSEDSLGGTIGTDDDILIVRSSDDGASWTVTVPLNPNAAGDFGTTDNHPTVETDRAGVWVAAWNRGIVPQGIGVVRSIDNGASWTAPVDMGAGGLDLTLVTDRAGVWVLIWESSNTLGGSVGTDADILFSRSVDNGVTWSPPAALNTDAGTDTGPDVAPHLATDGGGTWVAVWDKSRPRAATSVDNGATWSPSVAVSSPAEITDTCPRVATDGAGLWIVAWDGRDTLGGTIGDDPDILYASSVDDGASWSAPMAVSPNAATDSGSDSFATPTYDGAGNWYVGWDGQDDLGGSIGSDFDLLVVHSIDGGVTWTAPMALNATARRDSRDDFSLELGYDGSGRWVAAWISVDSLGGTIGTDSDVLATTSGDDCPSAPVGGCLTTIEAGRSKIRLKNRDGGKDKLTWTWKGEETLFGDLGDPTATANLAFCVYDDVATVPTAKLEEDMLGGQTCGTKPCWKATSDGFNYKDGKREHGPIKKARLDTGEDGKAKLKIKGQGPTLGPPTLPLDQSPSVRIQLLNSGTGSCWEATYSSADVNESEEFRARSD